MSPYFLEKFGNPSSTTHCYGWEADLGVETARKQISQLFSCAPKEIFFTSSATESNNLALRGTFNHYKNEPIHIIASLTEHKATLETLKQLAKEGAEITLIKPDSYGRLSAESVKNSLKKHTRLVSVIWANNEIGTLNPISELGEICESENILFHVDACQGAAYFPIDVQKNRISLMSISAHKMYGPKGVGALFIRQLPQRVKIEPILFGAGHERGLRPSTLNVPAIVGFGAAAEIAKSEMKIYTNRIAKWRDRILLEILKLPFAQLNGHPTQRLPNNLNFTFQDVPNSELLKRLPEFALSTGSACSTGSTEPSHVLSAIGLREDEILSSIRIGLHKFLDDSQIETFIQKLKSAAIQLHERRFY
jgi:cysteine desulfurase